MFNIFIVTKDSVSPPALYLSTIYYKNVAFVDFLAMQMIIIHDKYKYCLTASRFFLWACLLILNHYDNLSGLLLLVNEHHAF